MQINSPAFINSFNRRSLEKSSLLFNDSTYLMDLGANSSLAIQVSQPLTIISWICRNSMGNDIVCLSKQDPPSNAYQGYEFGLDSTFFSMDKLGFMIGRTLTPTVPLSIDGIVVESQQIIPVNRWLMAWVTYTGSQLASGVTMGLGTQILTPVVKTNNSVLPITSGNIATSLGNNPNESANVDGYLGFTAIYNVVLSFRQITNIFHHTTPTDKTGGIVDLKYFSVTYPNCLSYWQMGDGTRGSGGRDKYPNIYDQKGTANGDISSMPTINPTGAAP